MSRARAVIVEDDLRIPADAFNFASFRRWAASAAFPESGRIDFLAGAIEVDMSAENLLAHGILKSEIVGVFRDLVARRGLGDVFTDSSRVASRFAQLSVEPDVVVVLWESVHAGRVKYRTAEIEGPPDLIVEIVSDSSVNKDTVRLPPLYAKAGVSELWLIDARGDEIRFRIHALEAGSYKPVRTGTGGWLRSPRLETSFRLTRLPTPIGTWRYVLESKPSAAAAHEGG